MIAADLNVFLDAWRLKKTPLKLVLADLAFNSSLFNVQDLELVFSSVNLIEFCSGINENNFRLEQEKLRFFLSPKFNLLPPPDLWCQCDFKANFSEIRSATPRIDYIGVAKQLLDGIDYPSVRSQVDFLVSSYSAMGQEFARSMRDLKYSQIELFRKDLGNSGTRDLKTELRSQPFQQVRDEGLLNNYLRTFQIEPIFTNVTALEATRRLSTFRAFLAIYNSYFLQLIETTQEPQANDMNDLVQVLYASHGNGFVTRERRLANFANASHLPNDELRGRVLRLSGSY